MKRIRVALILTVLTPCAARGQAPAIDIEVTALGPVGGRLCPGGDNAVRVSLAWHGAPPGRAVPLRLELIVPGGPADVLLAEGSATLLPGSAVTTFTFLHVDVPRRLRGRGARLVARANADGAIPERDLSNDRRELPLDAVTDWSCGVQGPGAPSPSSTQMAPLATLLST